MAACDDGAAGGAALGEACERSPDCDGELRCRAGVCKEVSAGADGQGGEGEGEAGGDPGVCPALPGRGVGAPCSSVDDCGGGRCLKNLSHFQFPGGFCSQDVPRDGGCCPDGSLDVRIPGLALRPCLTRCASDSDCRDDEGYFCFLTSGVCFPPPHDDCTDDGGTGGPERHCHEALDGVEDGPFVCGDAHDNDADGLIDCDAPHCVFFSNCTGRDNERGAGFCEDRRDNDGDGKTDCDDSDCAELSICSPAADG